MADHPVVILGSARKQSDTRKCVELLLGNQVHTTLQLLDYTIEPYQYSSDYSPADNFLDIINLLLPHQVILFASPIYWYSMSGLLKTFFDRLTDLVTIRKDLGRQLKGKKVFLLAVGADEEIPPGFVTPFKLTADYLHMQFIDYMYIPGKQIDVFYASSALPNAFLYKLLNPNQ